MHAERRRLQQRGLFVGERIGHQEELPLVDDHLIAPAAADGLWSGQEAILAEAEVSGGAVAAGWLDVARGAALVKLIDDTVANAHELHVRPDVYDFAHHFTTKVHAGVAGQCHEGDARIGAEVDALYLFIGDARHRVADTHPAAARQRHFADVARAQRRE